MSRFRIIPVVDIMHGIAVHANKGLRNEYQPIHGKFSHSSKPQDLIREYHQQFNFSEAYIADLDSIIRERPNLDLLREIIQEIPLKIMLDAGVRNLHDVIQFRNLGLNKIILATETIDSFDVIGDAIDEIGSGKVIVSIDMKKQIIISKNPEIASMNINTIVHLVKEKGISEIILLDLSKIGSMSGGSTSDYRDLRRLYPDLTLIIGGGIKDINDIKRLNQEGFNGALVATALHKGVITPEIIQSYVDSE